MENRFKNRYIAIVRASIPRWRHASIRHILFTFLFIFARMKEEGKYQRWERMSEVMEGERWSSLRMISFFFSRFGRVEIAFEKIRIGNCKLIGTWFFVFISLFSLNGIFKRTYSLCCFLLTSQSAILLVMKKTKFNNLEIFLYYFLEKIAILSKDIVRIFFFFF